MPRISELVEASEVFNADAVPMVQSGATKKVTALTFLGKAQESARWRGVPADHFNPTPNSTSRILCSDTTMFRVGRPIRYEYGGNPYYGVIDAVVGSTHIDVRGAPLNTGQDITQLFVGSPELLVHVDFFIAGVYANATGDLLEDKMKTYARWRHGRAFMVGFEVVHETEDSGSQPRINLVRGTDLVSNQSSNEGPQVSGVAGTWVQASPVAINPANYVFESGTRMDVRCTVKGSSEDAENLTVTALMVLE